MEEVRTWRELLGKITSDSQERQRIAHALGLNPITLTRWATNKSNPRQDNLRPLLAVLPQYRQQLIKLIMEEYPNFSLHTSIINGKSEIPTSFYARVFHTLAIQPEKTRSLSLFLLILQQMLDHLDPHRLGLVVAIDQCVPPSSGKKVRSLRSLLGRGTVAWGSYVENQVYLFGAESQSGQAASIGYPVVVQTRAEKLRLFPSQALRNEESAVSSPILHSSRIAGCLYVSSTQPNYFSQERLDLIQSYTDLLVLAFDAQEFYALADIDLGFMPSFQEQQSFLSNFQQLVTQRMEQMPCNQQVFSREQAELMVLQEIEERLLQIAAKH